MRLEPPGIVWLYFSFQGRIRRLTYVLANLLVGIVHLFVLYQLGKALEIQSYFQASFWMLAFSLLTIVSIVCAMALSAKRLHDVGLTGWLCLLFVFPVLVFPIFAILCLWPGEAVENAYGSPPVVEKRPKKQVQNPDKV